MGLGGSTESQEGCFAQVLPRVPGFGEYLIHINAAFVECQLNFLIATMVKKSSKQRKPLKPSQQDTALQLRYGKIGIAAVAAAAPYQSGEKNLRSPPLADLTISIVVAVTSATDDLAINLL